MENKKEGNDKKACCCGEAGCGGCGRSRCCAGKAALVLVLLLIGGLVGYGAGRCHRSSGMCPVSGHPPMPPAK